MLFIRSRPNFFQRSLFNVQRVVVLSLQCRCLSSSEFNHHTPIRSTTASGGSNVYESSKAVHEYLNFHYGSDEDLMPYKFGPKDSTCFPNRLAEICFKFRLGLSTERALDIGCAVGGLSFQLTKGFKEVVGIDYSNHFIDTANKLKDLGEINYDLLQQGEIYVERTAKLASEVDSTRVSFYQMDACTLEKNVLGNYNLFSDIIL